MKLRALLKVIYLNEDILVYSNFNPMLYRGSINKVPKEIQDYPVICLYSASDKICRPYTTIKVEDYSLLKEE